MSNSHADRLAEANALIAADPYALYSFAAQNAEVEKSRAERYARTLLLAALAKRQASQEAQVEFFANIHSGTGPRIDLREVETVLPGGEYPDECTLVMKSGQRWSAGSGYNKTALQSAEHWIARVTTAKNAATSPSAPQCEQAAVPRLDARGELDQDEVQPQFVRWHTGNGRKWNDDEFTAFIGGAEWAFSTIAQGTTPAAGVGEQATGGEGCACRWDAEDKRVVTCERHQGWLDVIAEWADRARESEAKLAATAPDQAEPMSDGLTAEEHYYLKKIVTDERIEEIRKACLGANSGQLYANLFARAILAEAGIKEKTNG